LAQKPTSYLHKKAPGGPGDGQDVQKFSIDFKKGNTEATDDPDGLGVTKKLKLDLGGVMTSIDDKFVPKGERATVRISQFPPETTLKEVYEVVKPNMLDEITAIRISNHS
jgi:hypothetical protein